MNATRKVELRSLAPNLTCLLCHGYFIDATTIIECLHSFCKSCIVKYLETANTCPVCKVQLHTSKPLNSIRSDQMLQEIVYKLVPGLYQREMALRRRHYNGGEVNPSNQIDSGQVYNQTYISSDDIIHLSLQHQSTDLTFSNQSKRFVKCPAAVSIGILRKLIAGKYDLIGLEADVEILYGERVLPEDFLLMDVAYKYSWNQNGAPLELFYRIKGNFGPKVEPKDSKVAPKRRMSKTSLKASTVEVNGKNSESDPPPIKKLKGMAAVKAKRISAAAAAVASVAKPESIGREVQLRIFENGEMRATNVASGEEKIIDTGKKPVDSPRNHLTPKFGPSNHLISSPTDLHRNLKLNELTSPKVLQTNGVQTNGDQSPIIVKTALKRKITTNDALKEKEEKEKNKSMKVISNGKINVNANGKAIGINGKTNGSNEKVNGNSKFHSNPNESLKNNGDSKIKIGNGKSLMNSPKLKNLLKKKVMSPKSSPVVVKSDLRFSPNAIKTNSPISNEKSPKKSPKFFKSRHSGQQSEDGSQPHQQKESSNGLNGNEKKDVGNGDGKVTNGRPNGLTNLINSIPTSFAPVITTTSTTHSTPIFQFPSYFNPLQNYTQHLNGFTGQIFNSFPYQLNQIDPMNPLRGQFFSIPTHQQTDAFINSQSVNENSGNGKKATIHLRIPDLSSLQMQNSTSNVRISPKNPKNASLDLTLGKKNPPGKTPSQKISPLAEDKKIELKKVSKPEVNGHENGNNNGIPDALTLMKILKKSLIENGNGSLRNDEEETPKTNGNEKSKSPDAAVENNNNNKSVSLDVRGESSSPKPQPPFDTLNINNNEINRKPDKSPSRIDPTNCNNNVNDVSSA